MKHISYLSKLFYQFMYNQTKHKEKKHFCMYCLQQFSSLEVLNKHKINCMVIYGKQAIEMPKKGKNIFRYADFEAITEKVQGCQPKDNKLFTESYQKHTDCVYDYKVVCFYDEKYSKPVQIYWGKNAVYKFLEKYWKRYNIANKQWRNIPITKDKGKPEDRQGAVYKIKCCDGQATYIGETGRNLTTRLTEHKRVTSNGEVSNHIAEHHLQTKHQIDLDSATFITYFTDYYQRLTLESWFTNLEETPLIRSQQLPAPYKRLIDEIKHN